MYKRQIEALREHTPHLQPYALPLEEAIKYLLVLIEALREHTPHLQPYEIHLFLTPHRTLGLGINGQTNEDPFPW